MKRRVIRILILLWLGWYLSGPLAATIDFWDPPNEEMHDLLDNAGGLPILGVLAVCVGIALSQKLQHCVRHLARAIRCFFWSTVFEQVLDLACPPAAPAHSPPIPLRI
jgi:hypothetical protein